MKKFETPDVYVTTLEGVDVITTSTCIDDSTCTNDSSCTYDMGVG